MSFLKWTYDLKQFFNVQGIKVFSAIAVLLFSFTISYGQVGNATLVSNNAVVKISGIVNDSTIEAVSKMCVAKFRSVDNRLNIAIPVKSFKTKDAKFDSILSSFNMTNIELSMLVDGGVFEMYKTQNSNRRMKTEGKLSIVWNSQDVNIDYKLFLSARNYSSTDSNSSQGPIAVDIQLLFDSSLFGSYGENYFGNPMELVIMGANINQLD